MLSDRAAHACRHICERLSACQGYCHFDTYLPLFFAFAGAETAGDVSGEDLLVEGHEGTLGDSAPGVNRKNGEKDVAEFRACC